MYYYKRFGKESDQVNLCWIFSKVVNHIRSELECLQDSAWMRVKTLFGVAMVFTEVTSKLSQQQNFAVIRKNFDGTSKAFATYHRKFRGLLINVNYLFNTKIVLLRLYISPWIQHLLHCLQTAVPCERLSDYAVLL